MYENFRSVKKSHVKDALEDFRRRGRANFMKHFGFAPSKTWFIDVSGEPKPDLKMIAAHASNLSRPGRKQDKPSDFNTRDARTLVGAVLHYDLIGPGAKIENKIKDDIEKFDPSKLKKRFEERRQSVRIRQGAPAFRNKLLGAYRKCAVTGEKTRETLEAAHIVPYAGPSSNHVQNGVLLRADVHTLFDLELIGIRPEDCKIEVKPSLEKTPYFKHNGQKLKLPADPKKHPSPAALVAKWRKFKSG